MFKNVPSELTHTEWGRNDTKEKSAKADLGGIFSFLLVLPLPKPPTLIPWTSALLGVATADWESHPPNNTFTTEFETETKFEGGAR